MITLKKVSGKAHLKAFVKFPFSLYKDHPYWVPPLISDEMETFDTAKNPAFDSGEAQLFLAYKDGQIVGRIAALINWDEVNLQNKKKVRFGWWDVIDDVEVTRVLLEKVAEIGRENNLDHMEGPMGFSNLDKVGVISEGFDYIGTMISWYNYPYYITHLEQLGLVKEKEYYESYFATSSIAAAYFQKAEQMVRKRFGLKALNFTKTKDLLPYVDEMFDLFNTAYADLASFVPVSERQKAYFKEKYIPLVNPEYIKFVTDAQDKMVGFSVMMPSFSEALQKSKGKLLPFGWYHLLKAKKHSKEVLFYLIGVLPEYQAKGVTAVLFNESYNAVIKNGVTRCVRTPELEENQAVHNLWKHFDTRVHRRRRTYSKPI